MATNLFSTPFLTDSSASKGVRTAIPLSEQASWVTRITHFQEAEHLLQQHATPPPSSPSHPKQQPYTSQTPQPTRTMTGVEKSNVSPAKEKKGGVFAGGGTNHHTNSPQKPLKATTSSCTNIHKSSSSSGLLTTPRNNNAAPSSPHKNNPNNNVGVISPTLTNNMSSGASSPAAMQQQGPAQSAARAAALSQEIHVHGKLVAPMQWITADTQVGHFRPKYKKIDDVVIGGEEGSGTLGRQSNTGGSRGGTMQQKPSSSSYSPMVTVGNKNSLEREKGRNKERQGDQQHSVEVTPTMANGKKQQEAVEFDGKKEKIEEEEEEEGVQTDPLKEADEEEIEKEPHHTAHPQQHQSLLNASLSQGARPLGSNVGFQTVDGPLLSRGSIAFMDGEATLLSTGDFSVGRGGSPQEGRRKEDHIIMDGKKGDNDDGEESCRNEIVNVDDDDDDDDMDEEERALQELLASSPARFKVPDWSAMDPFTLTEKSMIDELTRCRADPKQYAQNLLQKMTVVLPKFELPQQLHPPSKTSGGTSAPLPPTVTSALSGVGKHSTTTTPPGSGVSPPGFSSSVRPVTANTSTAELSISDARAYVHSMQEKLEELNNMDAFSSVPLLLSGGGEENKTTIAQKITSSTTTAGTGGNKKKQDAEAAAADAALLEEQEQLLKAKRNALKAHVEECQNVIREKCQCLDRLLSETNALPKAAYNRGLCLAARNIAQQLAHTATNKALRRLPLSDAVAQFGKLTGELAEFVLYGIHDPFETVAQILLNALHSSISTTLPSTQNRSTNSPSAKSISRGGDEKRGNNNALMMANLKKTTSFFATNTIANPETANRNNNNVDDENATKNASGDRVLLFPAKLYVGAGWQRHPTKGAVTVLIVTSGFQEISYIKKHRNLPIVELKRCMALGQMSNDERLYDLDYLPEHYGMKPIRPMAHPVVCGARTELVLECPPSVVLCCTLMQGSEEPLVPTHTQGTTFVDRSGKIAKIHVVLQECQAAKLVVYAQHPQELVYKKSSTIFLRPVLSKWNINDATIFPHQCELFQKLSGELVSPRQGVLYDGKNYSFSVKLSANVRRCVIKGSSGTLAMVRMVKALSRLQGSMLALHSPNTNNNNRAMSIFQNKQPQPLSSSALAVPAGPQLQNNNTSFSSPTTLMCFSPTHQGQVFHQLPSGGVKNNNATGGVTSPKRTESIFGSPTLLSGGGGGNQSFSGGVMPTAIFQCQFRAKCGPLTLWADEQCILTWEVIGAME